MKKELKRAVFKIAAERFETNEIRDYFLDMCEEMPDYIFTMPSSTSGKYHNATQCQKFGQIYHEYMFASILEHLLRLKHVKEEVPTAEARDCMRCVPFFHDAVKCGWNGSIYTVHDHPLLAAEWVKNTKVEHDIAEDRKDFIANMCASHSGEWTTSNRSKVVLPEPKTYCEKLIHECDILSSRADLDWIIPQELKDIMGSVENDVIPDLAEVATPTIEDYKIDFGKYKGLTIVQLKEVDSDYLRWAKENITREPFRTLASAT